MSKLFRPKTMRRMVVFLAMIAPAIYLFGSLFSAFTGAHGEQVFADDAYPYEWAEVDGPIGGDDSQYRLTFPVGSESAIISALSSSNNDYNVCTYPFYLNGIQRSVALGHSMLAAGSDGTNRILYSYPTENLPWPLVTNAGVFRYSLPWVFDGDTVALNQIYSFFNVGSWERLTRVPVAMENSQYVFSQFFAKDNFLVQWGSNAISENPYGFAPFGYFWRYLDVNVLHLSNDQAGLMAYGYMYYASHVLLFDVGFILVTFFLAFIQKVADKVGGEDHA